MSSSSSSRPPSELNPRTEGGSLSCTTAPRTLRRNLALSRSPTAAVEASAPRRVSIGAKRKKKVPLLGLLSPKERPA